MLISSASFARCASPPPSFPPSLPPSPRLFSSEEGEKEVEEADQAKGEEDEDEEGKQGEAAPAPDKIVAAGFRRL
jgi:hypothetical protein